MEENKVTGKAKKLLESDKAKRLIIISGIIGIALIFLSSYISFDFGTAEKDEEEFSVKATVQK